MSYRIIPLLILTAAVALNACGPAEDVQYESDTPAEEPGDVRETPLPDYSEALRSDFTAAEGTESDITGSLTLMQPTTVAAVGAPMRIRVQVSGLPEGEHAWHIHAGACGSAGEVVIPFTDTANQEGVGDPLEPDDEGIAEAEVDVPTLAERWVGPGEHSVHIHQDAGVEHGPTIACATL